MIHRGHLIQNSENFGEFIYAVISKCTVKMKTVVDERSYGHTGSVAGHDTVSGIFHDKTL